MKEKEEIVLGNKIKQIKINERQHFLLFVMMLIIFNLILSLSSLFVLIFLNTWYNCIICTTLVIACLICSFLVYRKIKNFHQCILYENAIVINSIWFNLTVELSSIYSIKAKETFLDKLFNLDTKSIQFKIINRTRNKFTLHFIEEDTETLINEIVSMIKNKKDSSN